MKKTYIVLTCQNCRDTTVANPSLRLLTEDPKLAIKTAREITVESEFDFVEHICIFAMEAERRYSLNEMRAWAHDAQNEFLVFMMWKKPGCSDEPSITYRYNDEQFRQETERLLAA